MTVMQRLLAGFAITLTMSLAVPGCAPAESPVRAELRSRLAQETRLSADELGRLCDELARSVAGRNVRMTTPDGTEAQSPEQQAEVFSMLQNRAGLFDEGLRQDGGTTYRILNGPGKSDNAEIEASQRLWIDVTTLQPRRYQFSYAFEGYGDFSYGLQVEP